MKSIAFFIHLTTFFITTVSCATMDTIHRMDSPTDSLRRSDGPTTVTLGRVATLEIPAGLTFLDRTQTRTLLKRLGTETSGDEVGFIASDSQDWTVVIAFHEVGYVSDQGWEDLDASSILAAIRTTNRDADRRRTENGWATIRVGDWDSPPTYDPATRRIEWTVRTESGGTTVVNRVVNVLGRRGVLQMILVDPRRGDSADTAFADLVRGLAFHPGELYRDWRPGDPMATGGLAAIVSGMEVPRPVESLADPLIPVRESRASTAGEQAWLIGAVAALAGFTVGRLVGRYRRKHRFPARPGWQERGKPSFTATSTSSVRKPAVNLGAETVGGEGCSRENQIGSRREPTEKRQRRCDAYSFYERLTRDLHWTIND